MINQKFNKDRLLKYALYLKRGKLKCEKFCIVGPPDKDTKMQMERSEFKPLVILPIMELPIIFKGDWFYDEHYMPIFKEDINNHTISSIGLFFGINPYMFEHIFCPGHQSIEVFGGKILKSKPPISDIADNILKLLDAIKHYECIKGFSTAFNLN
jgi:hypothetical protein